MLDRVVSRVEGGFASLGRVVVTVGPGSFTGLRVGIAAARAVGLATGAPVVGVTTLSALIAPYLVSPRYRLVAAAIDARGGRVYAQAIAPSGRMIIQPGILTIARSFAPLARPRSRSSARPRPRSPRKALGVGLDARVQPAPPVPDIAWVARLGAAAAPGEALPKPLYLAAPDARPQSAGLPRL
jgi:tRNA threonylcarbamoyl adenosine modification protein YeaZ